ncbi:hypothetical protein KL929_000516 [Ogataea haglerorum]|nr:hypothetical protein KL951_004527 [Ogataea haglerorum]KAG7750207.1 hypothetical protein KL912_000767 [Ogataea haglerorum]KAG7787188.1 hypothetical protein KL910_003850 [Ogataea haglerorum]KAG7788893.1 hypothetical protein KL945_002332 [Ogataea haglerorum]KAG7800977.1 hypothetical protein KL929_000516 [Ogataea haglerorum]
MTNTDLESRQSSLSLDSLEDIRDPLPVFENMEQDQGEPDDRLHLTKELTKTLTLPPLADDDPFFDRFPKRTKTLFVGIVSFTCFLSPISNLAFTPAIPEVAEALNTTSQMINISNAIYNVFMAISPMMLSPLSSLYGKKPVMILSSLGYTISSILTAESQNLAMFFIFRAMNAFFGTCCFSVGGSIIGDIKVPKERGRAMSWVLMGTQLGPAFGPVLGGIIITYTHWRVIFYVVTGLGVINLLMIIFFLKETSRMVISKEIAKRTGKRFVFVKYNPFRVLFAFQYVNLILAGVISSSIMYNMFGLLTPIRHVINPRFNLNSPVLGSLFYLAPGSGLLLGGPIGGRFADFTVKRWIKKRGGERIPEDRLRSATYSLGFVMPVFMIIYGWSLQKKVGGMALPIVSMFFYALGQTIAFPSINSYCVDCLPSLKGDAIASNYFARYIVGGSVASATCLVQINNIGIGWTATISAFVAWIGFLSNELMIRYGASLRLRALAKIEAKTKVKKNQEN